MGPAAHGKMRRYARSPLRLMNPKLLIVIGFVAVLLLLAGIGVLRASQGGEDEAVAVVRPELVRTVTLERRKHLLSEKFYGLIEPLAQVEMAFQIPGRVVSLSAEGGDPLEEDTHVTKGQVVARLEPDRYAAMLESAKAGVVRSQAMIAAADARVAQARSGVAATEAGVAGARAKWEDAQLELKRVEELLAVDAATQRQLELAKLAVTQADAAVKTAEADKARAEAEVAVAQSLLAEAEAAYTSSEADVEGARVALQDAELEAPMDATVARVEVDLGQMVGAGVGVMTLMDLSKVRLVVGVPERKLPLLKLGQVVEVEVDALRDDRRVPRKVAGVVRTIPPAADNRAGGTGLFDVEIEIDNPNAELRPGMFARAVVPVREVEALVVPATAAQRHGDEVTAYLVDDAYEVPFSLGKLGHTQLAVDAPVARRVALEPLATDRDHYIIPEARTTLRRLVVEGQSKLRDDTPVRIESER